MGRDDSETAQWGNPVFNNRQRCPDKLFYIPYVAFLVRCSYGYSQALMASAACAAYAMHIIFGVFRKVIIKDKLDAHYINAARCYICGDKDAV